MLESRTSSRRRRSTRCSRWAAPRGRRAHLADRRCSPTRPSATSSSRTCVPLDEVTLQMPFEVADYVDFYCSLDHASNVGRIFRPDDEPLKPNWRHLPVGYHGRAGTVVVSGTDVRRPCGQRKAPGADGPSYGPSTPARHRGRARLRGRRAHPARRAGSAIGRVRRPRLRCDAAQRLVRPRHPGLGVRPPRAVPRQVVRHLRVRLGHPARRARRGPRRPARPGPRAAGLPPRRTGRRPRPRPRGGAQRRDGQPAAVLRRCTGPPPRCSRT